MNTFDVTFEYEKTFHLNGTENTFIGKVSLIGKPNGSWTFYDIDGILIEDPADRHEEFDLSQNPNTAKAVMNLLKQDPRFCRYADDEVVEVFHDHI